MIRVLLAAGILGVVWLAQPAPASAHPTLLFTDPAGHSAAAQSPAPIVLVFNEAVVPVSVVVFDDAGGRRAVDEPRSTRDGTFVTATPNPPLPTGTYLVRWRVTGSDGDLVEDEFRFAVGVEISEPGGRGTDRDDTSTRWTTALLRWLMFAGIAAGIGGLVARRFLTPVRSERPDLPAPVSLVMPGLLVGFGAVAGSAGIAVLDASGAVDVLWTGAAGRVLLVEAVTAAAAIAAAVLRRFGVALAALVPFVVAEGLRAHPNVSTPGWGAVTTTVHLAAAAVWVGALIQTVLAMRTWRATPAAARWVLARYMWLAAWTFAVVVGSGLVSLLLTVPVSALVTTRYGTVLLIKVALVCAAAALAVAARRSAPLRRDPTRGRTLMGVEAAALVTVLLASAALVSTPPAAVARRDEPPRPPDGPVVTLGTLAGQVGVDVAASAGQLVVRLATPRRGDYYATEPDQNYRLAGSLGDDTPLGFRGCGQGCFVAGVDWRPGDNVLTVSVTASGWRGGTVALPVPWPTVPGDADLAAAVTTLRAVPTLVVYETVTSDGAATTQTPVRLELTGEFFVGQEPYSSGTAPIARRISGPGQPLRLALGFPAASMNVLLFFDDHGRLAEETLTDTKHIVTRHFTYPE